MLDKNPTLQKAFIKNIKSSFVMRKQVGWKSFWRCKITSHLFSMNGGDNWYELTSWQKDYFFSKLNKETRKEVTFIVLFAGTTGL